MMKLTYHGHSTWEIRTDNHHLLMDPFLGDNPSADVAPDSFDQLDAILLTHAHYDHVSDAEEIAKRSGALVVANFEMATYYGDKGCETHGMSTGGAHTFPFGTVKLTIAQHGSTTADGVTLGNPCGIIFEADGKKIYNAGDTGIFLDMKLISELNGPFDVAMLPIGDNFTMGVTDAVKAAEFVDARVTIPQHFNTWPLIEVNVDDFVKGVEAGGRSAKVLAPGQSFEA